MDRLRRTRSGRTSAKAAKAAKAAPRAACLVACALVGSCGGVAGPSDPEGGGRGAGVDVPGGAGSATAEQPPSAPSSGELSGAEPFRAFVLVSARTAAGAKPREVPVLIDVRLGRSGAPLSGAVVSAGSLGKAVLATPVEPGRYVVDELGYAPWYEVSIEAGGAVLRGIRLRAPALHSVSVPARPMRGQLALVDWSPSHDSSVDDAQVRVFGWEDGKLTYDAHVADSGRLALPASALPSSSAFVIEVRRAASLTLAAPSSVAIVELTSSLETVVR